MSEQVGCVRSSVSSRCMALGTRAADPKCGGARLRVGRLYRPRSRSQLASMIECHTNQCMRVTPALIRVTAYAGGGGSPGVRVRPATGRLQRFCSLVFPPRVVSLSRILIPQRYTFLYSARARTSYYPIGISTFMLLARPGGRLQVPSGR